MGEPAIKDEHLIAYCGLYCGDCHGFNGRIPDLARDLRKELRASRYDKFAEFISTFSFGKDFKDYTECYKVLGAMVGFRCRKGCRAGGGSPFCKIRVCAQKKELEGCWLCTEFEDCKKLEFLVPVHGDAHVKNLRALKRNGTDGFLCGKRYWYNKAKEKP
ncbi:MAG: DUF3795 domain-containing protein [Candidatus Bathyarchaeia archaeon]